MCGICGVVSLKGSPITPDIIQRVMHIFSLNESRGKDASGILIFCPGSPPIKIMKGPHKVSSVIAQYESALEKCLSEGKDISLIMCHTRAATSGSPEENNNNHPIYRNSIYLTHNGCVRTDNANLKNKKIFDVDSELLILAHMEDDLKNISGSAAYAMFDCRVFDNKKLYLYTNSSHNLKVMLLDGDYMLWFQEDKFGKSVMPKKFGIVSTAEITDFPEDKEWEFNFLTGETKLKRKTMGTYSTRSYVSVPIDNKKSSTDISPVSKTCSNEYCKSYNRTFYYESSEEYIKDTCSVCFGKLKYSNADIISTSTENKEYYVCKNDKCGYYDIYFMKNYVKDSKCLICKENLNIVSGKPKDANINILPSPTENKSNFKCINTDCLKVNISMLKETSEYVYVYCTECGHRLMRSDSDGKFAYSCRDDSCPGYNIVSILANACDFCGKSCYIREIDKDEIKDILVTCSECESTISLEDKICHVCNSGIDLLSSENVNYILEDDLSDDIFDDYCEFFACPDSNCEGSDDVALESGKCEFCGEILEKYISIDADTPPQPAIFKLSNIRVIMYSCDSSKCKAKDLVISPICVNCSFCKEKMKPVWKKVVEHDEKECVLCT